MGKHGDGVSDVAFISDSVEEDFEFCINNGATAHSRLNTYLIKMEHIRNSFIASIW